MKIKLDNTREFRANNYWGNVVFNADVTLGGNLAFVADYGMEKYYTGINRPAAGVVTLSGGSAAVSNTAYISDSMQIYTAILKRSTFGRGYVDATGNTTTGTINFSSSFYDSSVVGWHLIDVIQPTPTPTP